jgi:hypothetical protein
MQIHERAWGSLEGLGRNSAEYALTHLAILCTISADRNLQTFIQGIDSSRTQG